jgi:hypothetical protein
MWMNSPWRFLRHPPQNVMVHSQHWTWSSTVFWRHQWQVTPRVESYKREPTSLRPGCWQFGWAIWPLLHSKDIIRSIVVAASFLNFCKGNGNRLWWQLSSLRSIGIRELVETSTLWAPPKGISEHSENDVVDNDNCVACCCGVDWLMCTSNDDDICIRPQNSIDLRREELQQYVFRPREFNRSRATTLV